MREETDENKILARSSFHEAGPVGHMFRPSLRGQNNKASSKVFNILAGEKHTVRDAGRMSASVGFIQPQRSSFPCSRCLDTFKSHSLLLGREDDDPF